MSIGKKVFLLLNPAAQGGRAAKLEATISYLLNLHFPGASLHKTKYPGHAVLLTRQALHAGAKLVIAAGGDGTISEVVNGFFEKGQLINPAAQLGIISVGTGQDLSRSLNLPAKLNDQFKVLHQKGKRVDIGLMEYQLKSGKVQTRYFINEAQMGLGGYVAMAIGKGSKPFWGNKLIYSWHALRLALKAKAANVSLQVDAADAQEVKVLSITCANGAYMGGGMHSTPGADLQDGFFDILTVEGMPFSQRLLNFPRIYTGTHLKSPFITLQQGREVTISSKEEIPVEADGDFLGYLPIRLRILPSVLPLASP